MPSQKPLHDAATMTAAVDPTGILTRALVERVGAEAIKAVLKTVQELQEERAKKIAEENDIVKKAAIQAKLNPAADVTQATPRLKK